MKLRVGFLGLALATALTGCGESSSTNVASVQTQPQQMSGLVYLESARAGSISLVDAQGAELARSPVDGTGSFFLPLNPAGTTLVATLATGERVERSLAQGGYPWINALSHLVSLYAAAHPGLPLGQAEAAVLAGLSIPAGTPTNGLSSLAGTPFSHQRYLDEARRNGGFEAFSRQVAGRLGAGERLSFPGPEPSLARQLLFAQRPREVIRASVAGDLFGFIAKQVGGDVITLGTNDLLGMISSALGLNLGTANKLNAISQQLNQVLSELASLQNQVTAVNTSGQYVSNLNTLNVTLGGIQNVTTSLSGSAARAASANSTTGNTFDHGPAVPNGLTSLTNLLSLQTLNEDATMVASFLTSTVASLNQVLLYNQLAWEQLGLTGVVTSTEMQETFNYPLRQDAWTVGNTTTSGQISLQSNLDFYSNWLVQACNGLAEAGQATAVLPVPLSTSGVNQPATPLNQSRGDVIRSQFALLQAQQQVPAPMGYSPVFIDVPNGLMWCNSYFGGENGTQYATAQGAVSTYTCGPWTPGPAPTDNQDAYLNQNDTRFGPPGGWRLPTFAELTTLRGRASSTLYSSTKGIGLPALGFNVPSGSSTNSKTHLYGQVTNSQYNAFQWTNGQVYSEKASGGGPLFGYMYVRRIPDYTSGDTPQLAHTAYGYLPDGLQFLGSFTSSTGQFSVQNGLIELVGNVQGVSSSSNLSQRATFKLSNPSVLDITPNGNDFSGNWHAPGNATLTATVQGFVPGQSGLKTLTQSITWISPLTGPDKFTSIQITPYNVAYQAPPGNLAFQQYYLTGFTQGGAAMTLDATWGAFTMNNQTLNPSVAAFSNPADPSSLVYGPMANTVTSFQIRATYGGQTYTATVAF